MQDKLTNPTTTVDLAEAPFETHDISGLIDIIKRLSIKDTLHVRIHER